MHAYTTRITQCNACTQKKRKRIRPASACKHSRARSVLSAPATHPLAFASACKASASACKAFKSSQLFLSAAALPPESDCCGRCLIIVCWLPWTVTRDSTVLDIKRQLAFKWSLPVPEEKDDSKSRMLMLTTHSEGKWEVEADETLIADRLSASEWRLSLKRFKLGQRTHKPAP